MAQLTEEELEKELDEVNLYLEGASDGYYSIRDKYNHALLLKVNVYEAHTNYEGYVNVNASSAEDYGRGQLFRAIRLVDAFLQTPVEDRKLRKRLYWE